MSIVDTVFRQEMQAGVEFFDIDLITAMNDPAAHSVNTDEIAASVAARRQFPLCHIQRLFGVLATEQFTAKKTTRTRLSRKHLFWNIDHRNKKTMLVDSRPGSGGNLIDTANHARTTRLNFGGQKSAFGIFFPIQRNQ